MDETRKIARKWMKKKSTKEINEIRKTLGLTERQKEIYDLKFPVNKANDYITSKVHCSISTLARDLSEIYNKIHRCTKE